MKLPFTKLTNNQTDQNQQFLIELSLEEQKNITGGGVWQSQFFCDAYYKALAEGRDEWACIILNTYYS